MPGLSPFCKTVAVRWRALLADHDLCYRDIGSLSYMLDDPSLAPVLPLPFVHVVFQQS